MSEAIELYGLEWIDYIEENDMGKVKEYAMEHESDESHESETDEFPGTLNFISQIDFVQTTGTHYMGSTRSTYHRLCQVFGNPLTGDGYKTRAEWVIKFDDGVVATIYDWKQYHCPVHEVTTWNIGGHDKDVVYRIADILTLNDLQERYA